MLAVVVDVLSFTTTVSLATGRGARVYPHRWRDESAAARAATVGAELAIGRQDGASSTGTSLSPASMLTAAEVPDLVLPSPNGSTVCADLDQAGARVVAGCLRNASAVAGYVDAQLSHHEDLTLLLVPAGERWPGGSLRPAYEDLWGAGAVLDALRTDNFSLEARVARDSFRAVRAHLPTVLADCSSGRELVDRGFARDVVIAAETNVSQVVPVLGAGFFSAI